MTQFRDAPQKFPTNLSLDSESIYARSRLRDKFADIINGHFAFIAQFSGIELN